MSGQPQCIQQQRGCHDVASDEGEANVEIGKLKSSNLKINYT